jgi:hypothetical protein
VSCLQPVKQNVHVSPDASDVMKAGKADTAKQHTKEQAAS